MKNPLTVLVIFIMIVNIYGQQTTFLLEANFKDGRPISVIECTSPVVIVDTIKVFNKRTIKELVTNRIKLKKFLTDQSVYVTIQKSSI